MHIVGYIFALLRETKMNELFLIIFLKSPQFRCYH